MDGTVHSFKLEYTIENKSNNVVVVRHKAGLGYMIPSCSEPMYGRQIHLSIKISNLYTEKLEIDNTIAYSNLDRVIINALLDEKQRIKDNNHIYMFSNHPHTFYINVPLGKEETLEENGNIHSEILGFSLYLGVQSKNKPAMHTPEFTLDELANFAAEDFSAEDQGLRTFIYLNDPEKVLPKLYTNIIGNVVEVPSVSDSSRLPGLYMRVVGCKNPQLIPFYALDQVTDDLLLKVGIFKSKGDCLKGPGNTERLVAAETQVKELTKELEKYQNKITDLEELLNKSKEQYRKETRDLRKKIDQQDSDIYMYKLDTKHEIHTLKTKDLHNKYLIETVKAKASIGYVSEVVKNFTGIAGVIFTGYKLFFA